MEYLINIGANKYHSGANRWAQPTRARLGGLACHGVLWSPGGPPPVVIWSTIFYSKIILREVSAYFRCAELVSLT